VKSEGKSFFGSTGAVAGIEGCAAIAVKVDGLPLDVGGPTGDKESGEKGVTLELTGLPIYRNVRVGGEVYFHATLIALSFVVFHPEYSSFVFIYR